MSDLRRAISVVLTVRLSRRTLAIMWRHVNRKLRDYPRSYALISDHGQVDTAVLFVHGFWGDSVTAWQDFQVLIDESADHMLDFGACDCYFFDYPCSQQAIDTSASSVIQFLQEIFPVADASIFQQPSGRLKSILGLESSTIPSRGERLQYKRVVLVGHSAGAVVLRRSVMYSLRAALEKTEQDEPSSALNPNLISAELVLFAPAHLGFKHANLLGTVTSASAALTAITTVWQVLVAHCYTDLLPTSPVLQTLREQTERAAREYPMVPALRARVVWGDKENVVHQGEYDCDHGMLPVPGRGHIDICKPDYSFPLPMDIVTNAIRTTSTFELGELRRSGPSVHSRPSGN